MKLSENGIRKLVLVSGFWLLVTGTFIFGREHYSELLPGNCATFMSQPVSLSRCLGGNASFSVSVSGEIGVTTYQWYKDGGLLSDGGNIAGVTTPTLSISNVSALDEASYYCTVTDNCSSLASQAGLLTIPRPAAALGYRFQKSITIDHNKVSGGSDLYNFPVLVNIGSDANLRDSISGGHVQNSYGYDIIFTDGNYNRLDHQVESYDPVTGKLIAWVRLPVLSASVNTTVLMLYDNPQIIDDPSVKTVWNNSYQSVWHMGDNPGAASPQLKDAAQSNDGIMNGGMVSGNRVAGISGYAIQFDGVNDYFDVGTGISPAKNFTEECWIKVANQSDHLFHGFLGFEPVGGANQRPPGLWILNHSKIHAGFGDNSGWRTWQTSVGVLTNDNNTWNHLVTTFNGIDYKLFINGSEVFTTSDYAGLIPYNTPIQNIGRVDNYFTGVLDEIRVLDEALPSGWINTEYANQSSPLTFYSIGGESPNSAYSFANLCSGVPVKYSVPFTAGHSYVWSVIGGSPSSINGNSINVTWDLTGPYSIHLSESDGTCNGNSLIYSVVATAQPTISTQPVGATICYNTTQAMSVVVAGGQIISYQWQVSPNGTDTWTNVGSDSPNYTSAAITSNRYYKVIISSTGSGCNTPVESNIVGLLLESVVPTITCPGAISQNDDLGSCNASVVVPNATTADNCSVSSLTWTMTGATIGSSPAVGINQVGTYPFNTGVTTVTYIVKDAAGNQATCTFTVTIIDNINPSITCVANQTKTADANQCYYTVVGTEFNPTATSDNCAVASVTNNFNGLSTLAGAQFPVGVTTVLWTVTDNHSRTNTCSYTVTVTDAQDPSITCVANQNRNSEANMCYYTVVGTEFNPTATSDNCAVASVTNNFNGLSTLAGAQFPVGLTTVIWTVTDNHSRTNTCSYTVTVTDTQDPAITCVANQTKTADANQCYYTVVGTEFNPTATSDNCAVASVTNNFNGLSTLAGAQFPVGVTTVIWTVTDNHSRTNTCSYTVTVTDTQDPVISCVANQTRNSDANVCYYTAVGTEFNPASVSDNCGVASTINDFNSTNTLAGAQFPVGVTTVIWTVTDNHSRTNTCTYTVTVNDTQDPAITCVGNQTKTADANQCYYTVVGTEFNPTATSDNCAVASVTNNFNGLSTLAGAQFPVGVTTVIWTVTDNHSRTNTCSYTVTVNDTQDPAITCVANQAKTADANQCYYTVAGTEFNPTATSDNCSVSSVINDFNGLSTLAGAQFPVGVTTVLWTVTDNHSRTNTCSYTVTVTDTQDPVISCVGNQTRNSDANVCYYTAVGTEFNPASVSDNCGVASTINDFNSTNTLAGAQFPVGVTTVIWTVTDNHSRTNTCSYTVTVTDTQDPAITCVGNQNKNADADQCYYTVVGTEFNPTATSDNCSVSSVTNDFNGLSTLAGAQFPVGVTTVIWTVTDNHSRTNTCSYTVTVTDTQDPVISCVANQTRNSDANVCYYTAVGTEFNPASVSDNCGVASTINDFNSTNTLAGAQFPVGVTTVIWTVTDNHSRTNACSFTITVSDIQNPSITCVANQTRNSDANVCYYTAIGTEFNPTATSDNCAVATVTNNFNGLSTLAGAQFPVGVTTVIWTVTDNHSRTNTCTYTVTVNDTQDPAITCVANQAKTADANQCYYTVVGTEFNPTATSDNCSVSSVTNDFNGLSTLAGAQFPVGVTTVIWTVTDNHSRTNTCSYTVTVTDTQDPVISCVANQTRNSDANVCYYTAVGTEFNPASVSDNCGVASTINDFNSTNTLAGAQFPVGVTTVIWTVTDNHSRTNTCSFTITVSDNQNPSITCVANQNRNSEANMCYYTAVGTEFNPTATSDNCAVATVTNNFNGLSTLAGAQFPVGVTTVIWTVTDNHSRTNTCSYTVTVTDTQDPAITCVANQTKTADANQCYYTVVGTEFNPTATSDNCAVASVTNNFNGLSTLAGAQFPVGVTTVLWTVTDNHSRTNTCSYTVTVTDAQDPSITCVANQNRNSEANMCYYTVVGTEFNPTATSDNCAVASVTNNFNGLSTLAGAQFPVGLTTVIWTVTDNHSRTNTCSYTVTVTDTQDPAITCVANQTKTADANQCYYTVVGTEFNPTATSDNCAVASVTNNFNGLSTLAGAQFPVGVTTVIWTVTDNHSRTNTCSYTVTVTDTQDPVISCVANQTRNSDANVCYYTAVGTEFNPASVSDNCGVASTINDFNSTNTLAGAQFPVGVTTVIWTVTDNHSRTNTCTYTVTVNDTQDPAITCVGNQTKTADANQCYYTVVGTEFNPTATSDNCAVASVTNNFNGLSTLAGAQFPVGVTTVIWTVTDNHSRTNTCSFTITVSDIQAPSITCPSDVTLNCQDDNSPAGSGTATATDNCTPLASIAIVFSDVSTQSIDPTDPLHYNFVITRLWRATDLGGNFNECTQTITVHDVDKPVISCPSDVTIDCDDDSSPAATGNPVISDNCTPLANINITFSDVSTQSADPAALLHYNYTITRTWRAVDVAGNFEVCNQVITVHDIINPVITCPADVTLDCEDDNTIAGTGVATATDICAPVENIAISHSDLSTYDVDPSNVLHYNYIIARTWRATDIAGNYDECLQTITVHDIVSPAITCPADVTLDCEDDNTPSGTGVATATDICTPGANISITHTDLSTYVADPASILHYNYSIVRTWRATDVAGNYSECSQTITVHDISKPLITCPADLTINCHDDNNPSGTGTATATDICTPGSNISITFTDLSTYNSDPLTVLHYNYTIVRTWKATDVAGNYDECTQTITVQDITSPVITCPADITIDCDDDNSVAGTGTATVTDNCAPSANITITYSDVSTRNPDPSDVLHYNYTISRTWKATDISGNIDECIQTITVHDVTGPEFTVPASVTVCRASDCSYDAGIAVTGDVTDESDNCTPGNLLNALFADDLSGLIDCDNYGYILRTWTLTDISGNITNKVQTIYIEPTPSVSITNNSPVVCDGNNVNLVFSSPTFSGIPGDLRYVVTVTSTDPANLGGTASSDFTILKSALPYTLSGSLTNSSNAPITVTYSVLPQLTDCSDGLMRSVNVVVDPTPQVIPDKLAQTICNDGTINVILASPSTFNSGVITFDYTVTATGGVTGYNSPVSGLANNHLLADILHNPTNSPQTVTYTIVPVSPAGCPSGPSKIVVITVEPTPQVVPSQVSQTICNNGTTNVILGSPSVFTGGLVTFNYTVVATGGVTGFTTPSDGLPKDHVIADVLVNPTDAPQTVTYTVTPIGPSGCANGPPSVIIITVNPTPQVVPSTLSQVVCNDGTTNITLASPSTFTNGAITFDFTAIATGGVTGFTASGTGVPSDFLLADVLHNPTNAPQTVTYTITPLSPTGCSDGPVKVVIVSVDPTPQVVTSAATQKICNDAYTSIVFSSPSTFTSGDITFNYTVVATGGVTGFSTPMTGLPNNFTLSDLLHNPTDDPQTVTYTIEPVSPIGCPAGPSKTVVITVEPTPSVVPGPLSQTICNDGTATILLTSPSTFTNGVITFNYTVVATGGVTGFTTPVVGLPNNHTISDVLHNPSDAPQTVTYTIVPISPECSATDPVKVVVVIVEPTPQVTPTPASQSVCNDDATNIVLASASTFTSGVITFNFTATATGGVTGFTPSGTGIPKDYVIADILHNPTDQFQTVTYSITPISPTGCPDGPVTQVVVTVNPTAQVIPGSLAETICNDAPVNVVLNSPSTFNNGVITFNYTVTATGGVTGFTSPSTGLPKDYLINDVLHNPTDSPQTVTYTVIPVSPSGCTAGPSKIIVITVNPTPQVFPVTLSPTICNDATTNIVLGSPSTFTTGMITFNFTATATGGITGFTPSGTGVPADYLISDILHNPTDSPQTVTYTIVPRSPTGCPAGPTKVVVITVDPTPQVVPGTLAETICNDSAISVTLGSPSTFDSGVITFNYTAVATGGVTGFSSPVTGLSKDDVINDLLHNPTDIPQTVTYTIVPISPAGCTAGPSKIVVITINPTPQVIPSSLTQVICNDGTTNIILGSPSIFTAGVIKFNYTVTATGGVTGFTTPVVDLPKDHVIADVLHNPTDAPQTVTYTIIPLSPTGCPDGPAKIVIVTVNPTPQVEPDPPNRTICNDGTAAITLHSPSTFSSGLITFSYTVIATGGVTGFSTPVTGLPKDHIITDILHNPTDAPQTVTYTIVPVSPTGCAAGPSKIVVITVNPTPQVVPSTLAQTLCNDGTTNVILGSPSTFSSGVITFSYTVVATGGVTGFTSPLTGLPKDYVIADILHNPTDASQTVTYTIVPVSPGGCTAGPVKILVVTVNPTPRIFPIPANTIQCDSITTNIRLESPSLFSNGLITFKYTVTSTGSVTGFTTPINGLPNNHIIADQLINASDHFQVVTYAIVPVSPSGCADGVARSVTVTVNPTPRAVPDNSYPSICYTGTGNAPVTTEIILTSPTVMTSGTIVFDYTVSTTGGGAIVGNTSSGTNRPENFTISSSFQNNSDTIQSVNYLVIPKVDNAICVPGRMVVSEVKVHAKPLQNIIVTKPLTCSQGAGLAALEAEISKGANPYHLVWDGSFGYHKEDSLEIANLSSGKYVLKVTDNLGCHNKDSISILPVTAQPTIQAAVISPGNYNISCIGSTDGTIIASVAGGITPPYTYSIIKNDVETIFTGVFSGNFNPANPSTYRTITNLGAGSYSLAIRDINGCENLSRIVLRVPPPVVAPIIKSNYEGGFNITCKGYSDGSAWVQQPVTGGRGTYTYRWYTSDGIIPGAINTDRIDNLVAGTYFLEIKDILGCPTIQSTVISEPDGMQLASSQLSHSPDGNFNISCNGGNDGSINITVTGGSGNYIYSWTGPNGFTSVSKDITSLRVGTYTCSVRDLNGCILTPSPSFTLTEPTPLVINSSTLSVSTDGAYNINCYGANTGWVHLILSGGSTGSYTYTWTSTNGSGIVAGQRDQNTLTAGTYHLVVTDLNNCSVIRDITLTQPPEFVVQLAPVNITCKSPEFDNGSINLIVNGGIGPYTYLWSNGAISEDIAGLTPGEYSVTVRDINGCTKTATATIQLPPDLNFTRVLSDYNGFNISCHGMSNGAIMVEPTTGLAPFVYSWTGPGGFTSVLNNISGLRAGEYSLLITDINECKAIETIVLTEPGLLAIDYDLSESTAGGFNVNCAGDSSAYITVNPVNQVNTVSYLWDDGNFGKTRTNLSAGNYHLIITDANNCHADALITLTEPDSLKIQFNITPPFCPDKPDGIIEANVTGGVSGISYSYDWSNYSTDANLTNITEGAYELIVTDLNGCSDVRKEFIKAMNETCLIIPNAISPNGDLINDVWNIGMIELYPAMEVKIFNRWGQSIWRSEKGYPRPWDGTSNGSSLPIDSYHYIIDLHNGSKPMVGNVTIVR